MDGWEGEREGGSFVEALMGAPFCAIGVCFWIEFD